MFLTHIPRVILTPGSGGNGGNAAVCPGVVAEYNYICGLAAKQQSQIKSACTKWTISNDLGQNVHSSHFFLVLITSYLTPGLWKYMAKNTIYTI